MDIVDAQVHLWLADSPERPWPSYGHDFAHGREMTAPVMLRKMDEAGVAAAILVPPSWEGERNEVCLEAARRHPARFAVMGRLRLDEPLDAAGLAAWWRRPGMLGARVTFRQPFERRWLEEGTADWFWRCAEELGMPVMVFGHGILPQIAAIARRHPRLKLAVDHLALAGRLEEQVFGPLDELLALAPLENLSVKATCLPNLTSEAYPFPILQEVMRRTVAAFGPKRVFWGSDATKLRVPLADCVALVTEACDFLGEEEKTWIMGRALTRWSHWDRPESET